MPLPEVLRLPFADERGRAKHLAEGWREIEILEDWAGEIRHGSIPPPALRFDDAAACDIEALAEMAVRCFVHDRLHADPLVSKADADEFKRAWVRRAARSTVQHFDVATIADNPAGFLIWDTGRLNLKRRLIVDLLCVDKRYRRHKIACLLIEHAARTSGVRLIRAGTQATNTDARAFYASLGLRELKRRRQRTFHRP
jgi:ribosomal protein S18 acetylase RimI-like enzyme